MLAVSHVYARSDPHNMGEALLLSPFGRWGH